MDQSTLIVLVIVIAVVALAVAMISVRRKRRSLHLRQHFGPEYDRAVFERGGPSNAEKELLDRERRVHSFSIKTLTPAARDRFLEEWTLIQSRFVDDSAIAVNDADSLVNPVMAARGYPMADFEQRAADVSVSYPIVVQNYRAARVISQRYGRGQAGTEDLRQAMVHYRSLFDELLGVPASIAAARRVLHQRAS
jgi:hypothetical protein